MKLKLLAGGALAALLVACGSDPSYSDQSYYSTPGYYYGTTSYPDRYTRYSDDFRVVAIEVVPGGRRGSTGAGAVIGGIAGGVLGHQIGSGRGNDAATVAGAIGGAIVGNEVEKNRVSGDLYRVTVRSSSGYQETYVMDSPGPLRVGDRVRVADGRIYPIG